MQRVESGPTAAAAVRRAEPEQLRLFDGGGIDMEALRMERAAISSRRRSSSTRRAYESDWRDWLGWCRELGRAPLPGSPDTLSLYVVHQAQRGLLPSTIARRVTSVVARHLAAGHGSPAPAGGEVREVLAGLRRRMGSAPRRAKAALSIDDLRRVLATMPDDLAGVRDRAVLLLGFASGLRRSELAALQLDDVTFEDAGMVVSLARSKTDQEGVGRLVGVHRGRRAVTCPVRALESWIVERGRWPGPLFCPVVRLRRDRGVSLRRAGLSGRAIAAAVKAAVARVGLDPRLYGGHSLRAGCATAAAEGGAGELAIMGRTGHRSLAMLGKYMRHGTLFAIDPLAGVL